MINLRDIEDNLTPERVIELVSNLGSDTYIEKEDCIIFKTICHNINPDDASLKLYYYKKNKRFHCYTECGDNFSIFELFKRRYNLLGINYNFYQDIVQKIAGDYFQELESGAPAYRSDFNKYDEKNIVVNIPSIPQSLLNIFSFYPTKEWLNDGISEEAMKLFGIKYSIDQNKIIIPHYYEDGRLIGIRGRALNEEDLEYGKYMPVQIEDKIYSHPLGYNLYGLNFIKENIRKRKIAIVCESEKAVLQYDTMFGHKNNICVAVCGSSFSAYQVDLLLKLGVEKIVIAFDNEGETYKEKEKYYNKLKNLCERYRLRCDMGFIFDQKNRLSLKDSPTDKGKEIFLELFKEVIWLK